MARQRRSTATLSLSFIDAMACGLGAVVLLFMIINHATEVFAVGVHREVAERVSQLESEVLERRSAVEALVQTLEQTRAQAQTAAAHADTLRQELAAAGEMATDEAQRQRIAVLQDELRALEARREALQQEQQADPGEATRRVTGEGDRQYLTGLRIGGRHVLILVDASASMLDESIVEVIRRRNMPEAQRRASPKWQRTLRTVDWISAHVPADARFQLYTFHTETGAVLSGTMGQWQTTAQGQRLEEAVAALQQVVPGGGTSLYSAFAAAARLSPRPDNIYLITDGLPTQGDRVRGGTVTPEQRLRYFRDAVNVLPRNVPVNVMLLPMEGDPMAAGALWQLAQSSGGSFLMPSRDWP
jgi:Mg-chelatase subunit ChlD